MDLCTDSIGWLKTYHVYQFLAYDPQAGISRPTLHEFASDEVKSRPKVQSFDTLGELILSAVVVLIVLAIVIVSAVVIVLAIASPLVLRAVGVAAIVMAVIYGKMIYKYVGWYPINAERSEGEKAALVNQAKELDIEIESLRARHTEESKRIDVIWEKIKGVKAALKAEGEQQARCQPSPNGVPTAVGEAGAGAASDDSVQEQPPTQPGRLFGYLRAAANLLPVGRCPECGTSFAASLEGEDILGTKTGLVGSRPDMEIYEKAPVVEQTVTKAKRFKCKECEHKWRHVYDKTRKLRDACPVCHEESAAKEEGQEALNTDYTVVGGGPDKNYFQGKTKVEFTEHFLKRFRCNKCAHTWRHKATRKGTLIGVCPLCCDNRKVQILREKVNSENKYQLRKHTDVHKDRNRNVVGRTHREEEVVIRVDHWETTYRCRSCSHEWIELDFESYRAI